MHAEDGPDLHIVVYPVEHCGYCIQQGALQAEAGPCNACCLMSSEEQPADSQLEGLPVGGTRAQQ